MKTGVHHPHDKLFRNCMALPLVAREFLETHLSPELLAELNMDTLTLERREFIDQTFTETSADVLYKVQLKQPHTEPLFLLCEHQSTVDKNMAFRLRHYEQAVVQRHFRESGYQHTTQVISLVFYTGKDTWKVDLETLTLLVKKAPLPSKNGFIHPCIDLQRRPDHLLRKKPFSGLLEYTQKYGTTLSDEAPFKEILAWLKSLFKKDIETAEILGENILFYILRNQWPTNPRSFEQLIAEYLSPHLKEKTMTLAESYMQEGFEKGIQQGMQEGEVALLKHLLEKRFGTLGKVYTARLEQANTKELLLWSDNILEARTLDEVFVN